MLANSIANISSIPVNNNDSVVAMLHSQLALQGGRGTLILSLQIFQISSYTATILSLPTLAKTLRFPHVLLCFWEVISMI